MGRWAATGAGAAGWLLLAAVGAATARMDLVAALLGLAVLVLVPAGLPLHGVGRPITLAAIPVGLVATAALLLPRGAPAAVLAGGWVLLTACLAVAALRAWWQGARTAAAAVTPIALGYLVVGALWLVADRAGVEPAGFAPPFVLLTAVHFHHAGFVATTVVASGRGREGRTADAATALVVAGPPVVAVGFVAVPALQVVGAALLTAGTWAFALAVWRRPLGGGAGLLLRAAGLAVIAPMLLALHWAIGSATAAFVPLPIPTMAATHGVLNAVGFGLLGLLGRRLARPDDARPEGPVAAAAAGRSLRRRTSSGEAAQAWNSTG